MKSSAARATSDRQKQLFLVILFGLLVATFVIHIGLGSSLNYSPLVVLKALFSSGNDLNDQSHFVVWSLRLPRACGCLLAGALLGGVGSAFQALFRNPLADPYIVGTSSGAAMGGVLAIVLGLDGLLFGLAVPLAAFVTGLGSLGLVLLLARRRGLVEVPTLLLSGVLVGSLLSSLLSLALYISGRDANQILRWLLGSTDPMYWPRVGLMLLVLFIGGGLLLFKARQLNLLAVGEETAHRLGVDVHRLKLLVLITGGAMTAAAVGSTGIIGFVGLISPHIARQLLGIDWRFSLLGSFLTGAIVLLCSDIIAQRAISDGIPVGVVTALLGAPILLFLLNRRS